MEREGLGEVDINRSECVEHELNRLIERRHDQRAAEEKHKPSEELWQESVERYNAERDRQLRTEWTEYHQGQAQEEGTLEMSYQTGPAQIGGALGTGQARGGKGYRARELHQG